MKPYRITLAIGLLLLGLVPSSQAEVKKVQMKIAGYLCGN